MLLFLSLRVITSFAIWEAAVLLTLFCFCGESCATVFNWLNVDFTHLTAYQGSETFSLPNWLLKEGLNGVQCLIRGYLPIIFSICW